MRPGYERVQADTTYESERSPISVRRMGIESMES